MPYKLIIRLKKNHTTDTAFDWFCSPINVGGPIVSGENGPLDLKSAFKQAQSVVVIVPGEDVLLTEVVLPKMSAARIAKAIPFALEDQLTEEAGNLHFAQGPPVKNGVIPVAIVSNEKMREWESLLRAQFVDEYFKVKVCLPDTLAIPFITDTYQILIEDNIALVRTDYHAGFAIEKEQLFPVLQLALKRAQIKPTMIQIMSRDQEPVFTDEEASALGVPIQINLAPNNLLAMMASVLQDSYPVNLLQGAYRAQQKKVSFERLVLIGFSILGAWLLVITLTDLASYFLLNREKRVLDKEMQEIYATVYPNTPVVKDPKARFEKELKTLRANRADSAFFRLLKIIGPTLSSLTESGLTLKDVNYRNNQFVLDIEAKDLSVLDKLRQNLEIQGLKVVQNNAQRGSEGLVETQITVEEVS